ncbi:MAG: hypothetical protein AB1689_00500 [Thermodesulfobacteriota bacterium]
MTRSMILLGSVAMLALAGCDPGPRVRGPVQPAPPGPIDALRSVWGDYSGRCPDSYAYCEGDSQAICCPLTARCCEDENGAYCCDDDRYGRSDRDYRRYRDRDYDYDYDDGPRPYEAEPYRYESDPY